MSKGDGCDAAQPQLVSSAVPPTGASAFSAWRFNAPPTDQAGSTTDDDGPRSG